MTGLYRLAVVKEAGKPEIVVERSGRMVPLSTLIDTKLWDTIDGPSPVDLKPLLSDWRTWTSAIEQAIARDDRLFETGGRSTAEADFYAPLANPGKIICVGSNFHDHIEEMGIPVRPTYPYTFLKPVNNTVRGSGDPVKVPRRAKMMDWEAELGVVIGDECVDIRKEDALSVIAGYTNFNDLSARDWLATSPAVGIDWVQHKAFDGFAPFGPYLLPAKFVADPQQLSMKLSVNGELKQNSSTAQMVFGVADIIQHLSSIMTLMPGDIIATGTPAGVGHGQKPPQYLQAGDVVEIEIGDLGTLVTPIV